MLKEVNVENEGGEGKMKELNQKLAGLCTYVKLVKVTRNLNLFNRPSENLLPAFWK